MNLPRETVLKFFKFCLVGLLNTAVTISAFVILHNILGIYYIISSAFAYLLGIINSYLWNRRWTFGISGSNISGEFLKFVLLNITGLCINTLLVGLFVEYLGFDPLAAQAVAIAVVLFLNFGGSMFWVFRR